MTFKDDLEKMSPPVIDAALEMAHQEDVNSVMRKAKVPARPVSDSAKTTFTPSSSAPERKRKATPDEGGRLKKSPSLSKGDFLIISSTCIHAPLFLIKKRAAY